MSRLRGRRPTAFLLALVVILLSAVACGGDGAAARPPQQHRRRRGLSSSSGLLSRLLGSEEATQPTSSTTNPSTAPPCTSSANCALRAPAPSLADRVPWFTTRRVRDASMAPLGDPSRLHAAWRRFLEGGNMTIVFLGGSVTSGVGRVTAQHPTYPDHVRRILGEALGEEAMRRVAVINSGVSASQSRCVQQRRRRRWPGGVVGVRGRGHVQAGLAGCLLLIVGITRLGRQGRWYAVWPLRVRCGAVPCRHKRRYRCTQQPPGGYV